MWRLAKSLEILRNEVNAAYPNRSKVSDGTIGDTAHQAVPSDHNPNPQGVVCALDLTHHAGYFDAHELANRLITNRHPALKYIISNRRIAGAWTNWNWTYYSGSNPHDKHIHVSVGVGSDGRSTGPYDDTSTWNVKGVDMITKDDVAPVRIVMSEVEGWNGNDIHAGKNDAQIMGAWVGKSWQEFIWNGWNKQAVKRQNLVDQIADLNTKVSVLEKRLEEATTKLAVQSEDTELLNGFGLWLTKLIARLGLKK